MLNESLYLAIVTFFSTELWDINSSGLFLLFLEYITQLWLYNSQFRVYISQFWEKKTELRVWITHFWEKELQDVNIQLREKSQNCEIQIRNYLFYSVVETGFHRSGASWHIFWGKMANVLNVLHLLITISIYIIFFCFFINCFIIVLLFQLCPYSVTCLQELTFKKSPTLWHLFSWLIK